MGLNISRRIGESVDVIFAGQLLRVTVEPRPAGGRGAMLIFDGPRDFKVVRTESNIEGESNETRRSIGR